MDKVGCKIFAKKVLEHLSTPALQTVDRCGREFGIEVESSRLSKLTVVSFQSSKSHVN